MPHVYHINTVLPCHCLAIAIGCMTGTEGLFCLLLSLTHVSANILNIWRDMCLYTSRSIHLPSTFISDRSRLEKYREEKKRSRKSRQKRTTRYRRKMNQQAIFLFHTKEKEDFLDFSCGLARTTRPDKPLLAIP